MEFVHLHNHTEYSLLDGANKIANLVLKAKKENMKALAITDHGNLFGVIEFYNECLKEGIKPIIGMEAYVAVGRRDEKRPHPTIQESSFHVTLLAMDLEGYHNLLKLASYAYLEGFYYKPRIDKELLDKYHKGIVALSGCQKGEINYYLKIGDYENVKKALFDYLDIFGRENFFLEIMRIGLENEDKINSQIIKLAKDNQVNLVATNDCHYLSKEDYYVHDILLCIQTNKKIDDQKRLKFESKELYFKSKEEMAKLFEGLEEALRNSWEIAERATLYLDTSGKNFHLPKFQKPKDFESNYQYLSYLVRKGLENLKEKNLEIKNNFDKYLSRLNYELSLIEKIGFTDYFLIVKDIIDFAKRENIPVGPGRGSAVGSLVLYTLGITNIDPLKYGLMFERFINPERVTMPDIDIDFSDEEREKVIDYLKKRYGEENVAQIITFGRMMARAVIRDVGRVMGIPLEEIDMIAKTLPMNLELAEAYEKVPEFRGLIDSKKEYKKLYENALKLEGVARHASIHASGIVIAPGRLIDYVPLYKTTDGDICTQYDMDSLAAVGLLKMDILGLKTLRVIEETYQLVIKNNKEIKREVPFDDKKTYELLGEGKTLGVFQLESAGMREILRKLNPTTIEDLIAVLALYRPGPLLSGDVERFIRRKKGKEEIVYPNPLLEDVLKETYGMILYQEQVMQIAAKIADFTLGEADILRRAMSKKIPELMTEMKEKFILKAKNKGIKEEEAQQIFELLIPFAGYGFNKSHAAGYAYLSYLTAYLKANYPKEFLCATLTSEINAPEKIEEIIKEAKSFGIEILPPDINKSYYEFVIEEHGIRYGLGALKGIGKSFCEALIKERKRREFSSFEDFIMRTKPFGNKKAYEVLIKAGCFDSFNIKREILLAKLPEYQKGGKEGAISLQFSLFEEDKKKKLKEKKEIIKEKPNFEYEKEVFGFYFSYHPLKDYKELYEVMELKSFEELEYLDKEDYTFLAVLTERKTKYDKNGKNFAILGLEDLTGKITGFLFNEIYEGKYKSLKKEEIYVIKGRAKSNKDLSIVIKDIYPIEKLWENIKRINIEIKENVELKNIPILKDILIEYPGEAEVIITYYEEGKKKTGRLTKLKIKPNIELLKRLKEMPIIKKVKFQFI
ncbi:MAG: DNA polymerase III subunit alpha [candidate division WOR-3 bacterium]|nr:DNA polymerase III subunit alpha [candidate division WOR-3 bacterium]MCX7837178.1 DNA polymerase III subunit alpha [candidate division WOR-3 bacterium]MDW8114458.1 DNA polymerase III subunit alpha [candidate division WOR-3 bacterium]